MTMNTICKLVRTICDGLETMVNKWEIYEAVLVHTSAQAAMRNVLSRGSCAVITLAVGVTLTSRGFIGCLVFSANRPWIAGNRFRCCTAQVGSPGHDETIGGAKPTRSASCSSTIPGMKHR